MPNDFPISTTGPLQTVADILLSEHLLTPAQYQEIKVKSAAENKSIDDVLYDSGIVPQEKFSEAKAKLLGIPFISLSATSFSPEALSFIPRAVAERFLLIPFSYDDKEKTLSVAMS